MSAGMRLHSVTGISAVFCFVFAQKFFEVENLLHWQALHLKAQDADNIYWMQEEESRLKSKSSGNNGNPGKKDSHKSSNSNNSLSKPSTNFSSNNNSSLSSSSKPSKGSSKDKPKNSISNKLGKNGKLTRDECDCCMKEGLCLYCCEKGHVTHDCPKSVATKAHTAKVLAPKSKADSADSKK